LALSHSPSIALDGLVLCLDAGNPKKSYKTDNNLLDLSTWYVGANSTTGVTGFGFNETDSGENTLIADTDPFGNTAVIWKAQSPDGNADGGWNTNYIDVDHTKLYRFSVWVNRKVTGTDGRFYFGTRGYNSSLSNVGVLIRSSGNNSTNPYFYYSSEPPTSAELPEDEWVLVVAHVWPSGSGTGSNKEDSGIYNTDGTKRNITTPFSLVDMVWNTTVTKTEHRTYLFYSEGDASVIQHWAYPRIDLVDGTEPSISDLINNRVNDRYWYDISGNNRNATLLNGIQFSSENGGCLDFNRTDDSYAIIPHDSTISNQVFGTSNNFTLSAWFVIDEYVNYSCFIQKAFGGSYSNTTAGLWSEATNELKFVMGTNEGSNPSGSNLQITYIATPGVWYNMVGVADGTNAILYINGEQVGSPVNIASTLTRTRSENGSPITIGTRCPECTPECDGRIANVSVYNRGLTADEVKQNYNALRGRFSI
jgi:hypothetical protein